MNAKGLQLHMDKHKAKNAAKHKKAKISTQ